MNVKSTATEIRVRAFLHLSATTKRKKKIQKNYVFVNEKFLVFLYHIFFENVFILGRLCVQTLSKKMPKK